ERYLIHPRKANQEDIHHCEELEWDQEPAIAPLADRFGEAQKEQKAIVDDGILHMARRKTRDRFRHIDMDERRTWTRACDTQNDELVEAADEKRTKEEKDGCHKPGNGRPTPAPDNHSEQRSHDERDRRI